MIACWGDKEERWKSLPQFIAQDYIEIWEAFLIPFIENRFGEDEVIFQDDNTTV